MKRFACVVKYKKDNNHSELKYCLGTIGVIL